MIGQKRNKEFIVKLQLKRSVPRTMLIHGEGERLELAKFIGKVLGSEIVIVGKSVDNVREVISSSYNVSKETLYILEYGDLMSSAAINALLKITEEPPNNAYFIILCEELENMLPTIISRSTSLEMEEYSPLELSELTDSGYIAKICDTPERVRYWNTRKKEFEKFLQECYEFVSHIERMSGVDILAFRNRMKFKEDQEGYDPIETIQIMKKLFVEKGAKQIDMIKFFESTNATIKDLKRIGINKAAAVDGWLLYLREIFS